MTTPLDGDPAGSRATAVADGDAPHHLSHRQIVIVLSGVMSGMALAALDQSIVGTALPRIVSELGGLDKLSWVVTAYLLTSTAGTPLWGKISDLYGRRLVFQVAICIFVLGSALSGLAQDMGQLIAFRALQGLGGGGLMALAFAIIGDVIPPRDRGRYQGFFGAVFGVTSVAGPLLGGFFTDGPGWRWIFWINLPIGIAALVITSAALKMPVVRRKHDIDYLGAALIVAAVTSLLLYLDWAGKDYGYLSAGPVGLVVAAVVLATVFVAVELRASEPILPMRLFRNSVFSTGNLYAFLAGTAMFGAIIFLPVYLQAVKGMSPTESGLAMLPIVLGIVITSMVSGQLVSRTGRYKAFPIVGSSILLLGLLVLTRVRYDTEFWYIGLGEFLVGAGLGCSMQTVVVAIQNSVAFRDLGTATSAVTFFRQMGGAIGAAVSGAVLSSRLAVHLAEEFAGTRTAPASVDTNDVQTIQNLAEPVRTSVRTAFAHALDDVFFVAVPFVVAGLLVALFLKEIPLRTGPNSRNVAPAESTAAASS